MKKRIERYFTGALAAIKTVFPDSEKEIPREYQGYVSAFGAMILQMGLLPTLAVHADAESGSKENRDKVLDVLCETILANEGKFLSSATKKALLAEDKKLFNAAVKNPEIQSDLREALLDAVVAVKLCLRTFKMSKS